jgi:hypothetical protein
VALFHLRGRPDLRLLSLLSIDKLRSKMHFSIAEYSNREMSFRIRGYRLFSDNYI